MEVRLCQFLFIRSIFSPTAGRTLFLSSYTHGEHLINVKLIPKQIELVEQTGSVQRKETRFKKKPVCKNGKQPYLKRLRG